MQQYRDAVLSPLGRPIVGATVTVTLAAGGGAATLYTANGSGALGSNVITVDATTGAYQFYAANGRYTLSIAASGYTTTTRDAELWDPADTTAPGRIAYTKPVTGAVSTTLGSWLAGQVRNVVADFGADPTGVADSTAAIQAAINSYASGSGTVYFPPGVYKVTSTVTVAQDRIHLVGAGPYATKILFAPTANGTCFKLAKAVTGLINRCSISGFSFWSDDSTYVKTAIEVVVGAEPLIEHISIGGSVVHFPNSSYWSDSTRSCVGVQIRGHEAGTVSDFQCYADYPIKCDKNPNDDGDPTTVLDLDSWVFRDLYLGATENHVTFATGLNFDNVQFVGRQNWVRGKHGFIMNDTTCTRGGVGLTFENVRTEQPLDATKETFRIVHNDSLYNLVFRNCRPDAFRPAFYLRKCIGVHFDSVIYESTSLKALDADATVDKISGHNNYWQAGSTKTLAGQRPVLMGPSDPSTGALPPSFEFSQSSGANRTLRTGLALFGSNDLNGAAPISMAADAVEIVASSNATGTLFLSTQEGVSGVFQLRGTTHAVYDIASLDPAGFFTGVKDSASAWNVYWDSGLDSYVVQNKRGITLRVGWLLIGSDTAI